MPASHQDQQDALTALKEALVARALSPLSCGENGDHRLAIYRTPAGQLMCVARAGALISETRITAAICGTDQGCSGMWRCLSTENEEMHP